MELTEEKQALQSCTKDEDCGKPLTTRTCWRDVVRINADTTHFEQIMMEMDFIGCEGRVCTAEHWWLDGFRCREKENDDSTGICTWKISTNDHDEWEEYLSNQTDDTDSVSDDEEYVDDVLAKTTAAATATTTTMVAAIATNLVHQMTTFMLLFHVF